MDISVVIPIFNEEKNIKFLVDEITDVLKGITDKFEIILIDDGSKDRSFFFMTKIMEKNKHLRIIKFRKNFGQTSALDAGFSLAQGKVIIEMDGDLQNDPHDIPNLLEKMGQGYDVVSGWRHNRIDSFLKKIISKIANVFRKAITGEKIHDSGCSLKAYKKECLVDINLFGEMHRFIPLLLMWKGYKIGEVKVNHRGRKYGKTKYNFVRVLKGFLDLLVIKFWMQYSTRPMHLFGGLGILSFLFGFLVNLYLTFRKFFFNESLTNRPLLLLGVLFMILGFQLIILGLLADILIKTYYGGNRKSYYIEKVL
ncbi:MAG: glycosyltransferase family 2 protein [Candidatus Woesearchaeota archaeon]